MAKVKRSTIAFIIGAFTGFIWLWPVYGPANPIVFSSEDISITRVARLLTPLLVWLLISPHMYAFLERVILPRLIHFYLPRSFSRLVWLGIALAIFPLVTGLLFGNASFLISAVMPLVVSAITLIGCAFLESKIFRQWVFGITFVATCFLTAGIATSRLATTSYYTRPRVLMGFNHPTTTASVILAAGLFFALLFSPRFLRWRSFMKIILAFMGLLIFIYLLYIAQNRNTLICLLIGIFIAGLGKKLSPHARFSIFLLLLVTPFLLYFIALYGSQKNPAWEMLNELLSNRLSFYYDSLDSFLSQDWTSLVFAPIDYLNSAFSGASGFRGFAATDSAYLSILFNYGLPALISFVILLIVLAFKLSSRRDLAIGFGALCGITAYFSIVSEGITSSNLAIFIIFAYVVRSGIDIQVSKLKPTLSTAKKQVPGSSEV